MDQTDKQYLPVSEAFLAFSKDYRRFLHLSEDDLAQALKQFPGLHPSELEFISASHSVVLSRGRRGVPQLARLAEAGLPVLSFTAQTLLDAAREEYGLEER